MHKLAVQLFNMQSRGFFEGVEKADTRTVEVQGPERRSCSFLLQILSVAIQRGNLVVVLGTLIG